MPCVCTEDRRVHKILKCLSAQKSGTILYATGITCLDVGAVVTYQWHGMAWDGLFNSACITWDATTYVLRD